jgi:polysaccharide biosynthesis transport protein
MPEAAEVALRLARLVSSHGLRVALVDTRFNESLSALEGNSAGGSLAELICGRCAFDAAVTRDPGSRVHVIAAGGTGAKPLQLVSSDKMEAILSALTETYDVLVLLAPHLSRRAELQVVGNWAHLAVLAERGNQSDSAAAQGRHHLSDIGIEDVAVVTVDSTPAAPPDLMSRAA